MLRSKLRIPSFALQASHSKLHAPWGEVPIPAFWKTLILKNKAEGLVFNLLSSLAGNNIPTFAGHVITGQPHTQTFSSNNIKILITDSKLRQFPFCYHNVTPTLAIA